MKITSNCGSAGIGLAIIAISAAVATADPNDGLIAHWKLAGDVRDHSGGNHDAKNHGVDLKTAASARFDGRGAHLEVADAESLRSGAADFTLALWVHTDKSLDDVIG